METQTLPPAKPLTPGPQALAGGLRLALHYWPILLALWLGTLLATLPAALAPAERLLALANRPVIAQLADGLDAWQVLDFFGLLLGGQAGPLTGRESPTPEISPGLAAALFELAWAALLVPLLGGVISAFLYGGILLMYSEAPASFQFKRFLYGCWRWFGAFLLLGFLQAGLFLVGLLPVILVAVGLSARAGWWGMLLVGLLAALGLAIWLIVFETIRVRMAVSGRRNPFYGLSQALVLLRQRPGTLLSFYGLALLGLLALHAFYRLILLPLAPLDLVLVTVFFQHSFIFLRLLARAARLAGLVKLMAPKNPFSGNQSASSL